MIYFSKNPYFPLRNWVEPLANPSPLSFARVFRPLPQIKLEDLTPLFFPFSIFDWFFLLSCSSFLLTEGNKNIIFRFKNLSPEKCWRFSGWFSMKQGAERPEDLWEDRDGFLILEAGFESYFIKNWMASGASNFASN